MWAEIRKHSVLVQSEAQDPPAAILEEVSSRPFEQPFSEIPYMTETNGIGSLVSCDSLWADTTR